MAWHQFNISCNSGDYASIDAALEDLGALAISIIDAADQPLLEPKPNEMPLWDAMQIQALFAIEEDAALLQATLQHTLGSCAYNIQYALIADQDWQRAWMDHYHAMCFGKHLWIVPSHKQNDTQIPDDAIRITLDPGLAFGTGTHATTALCLTWLADNLPQRIQHNQDFKLMDFGCGSGILAIAALKLGGAHAYIADIDPQALSASMANAKCNQVDDKISIQAIGSPTTGAIDLWIANILAAPLIELAADFASQCPQGCELLLSGILLEQELAVTAAYAPFFDFEPSQYQDGWVLLRATRR